MHLEAHLKRQLWIGPPPLRALRPPEPAIVLVWLTGSARRTVRPARQVVVGRVVGEQGEKRSDQALDKAEQLADDKTGGTFDQRSPDGSAEASKEDG